MRHATTQNIPGSQKSAHSICIVSSGGFSERLLRGLVLKEDLRRSHPFHLDDKSLWDAKIPVNTVPLVGHKVLSTWHHVRQRHLTPNGKHTRWFVPQKRLHHKDGDRMHTPKPDTERQAHTLLCTPNPFAPHGWGQNADTQTSTTIVLSCTVAGATRLDDRINVSQHLNLPRPPSPSTPKTTRRVLVASVSSERSTIPS